MNKELDLLVAVTPSEKHMKYMNLSHTYHVVPTVLVTRTDMPFVTSIKDFNEKKVVVGKGHVTEQWIKRDYPNIQVIPIDDYENGLRLVSEGKADAYAAAMGVLTWQIKKHRITNLKIATKSPYEYKLSIAVRKDWPEFIPIINKSLASIEKSKQDSIYDKWVTVSFEKGIDWIFVWKISFIIIAFSTTVFLIILIWNRRLKSEIIERKKVEEVLKINEQFLNETGRVARVGGWEVDAETHEISWTEETYRIFEIPIGRIPSIEEIINHFHPDERQNLKTAFQNALNNGQPYDMAIRFTTAKGNHLWTKAICNPQIVNGKVSRLVGIFQDVTEIKESEKEREKLIDELQKALNEIKTLRGILPICSYCKKIRDDKGYWNQIEKYISDHSEAGFSHGICPECAKKMYPDYYINKD